LSGVRVSGARKYAAGPAPGAPLARLADESYTVTSARTLKAIGDDKHPVAVALAAARRALTAVPKGKAQAILREHLARHPEDRNELQVVSEDELAAA